MHLTCRLPLLLLVAALPAGANLRAPYRVDGKFGAHIDAEHAHPELVLVHERFDARLPTLSVGDAPPTHAGLSITYTIDNVAGALITLPVRFLAIGASDARVEVNGAPVAHQEVRDPTERAAALAALAASRCRSVEGCEPERVRASLEHELNRDTSDVDSIAFEVAFVPGPNTIRVRYAQALTVREGAYGYFMRGTFGTLGASYGFDYLLFPAQTWRHSERFRFDVTVDVPDVIDRGWWSTSFLPPVSIESTLPLATSRAPHPSTTLRGQLTGFPVDVFTLTVHVPRQ